MELKTQIITVDGDIDACQSAYRYGKRNRSMVLGLAFVTRELVDDSAALNKWITYMACSLSSDLGIAEPQSGSLLVLMADAIIVKNPMTSSNPIPNMHFWGFVLFGHAIERIMYLR